MTAVTALRTHRQPVLRQRLGAALLCLLLSACAAPTLHGSPPPNPAANNNTIAVPHWQGKLAVRVYRTPVQAFSAEFELQGTPEQGELVLSSALGTTLARLHWSANVAVLRTASEERHFDSIGALAQAVTGADIPVTDLFAWLQGQPGQSSHWVADLHELNQGRLLAHTRDASPAAELKMILEP